MIIWHADAKHDSPVQMECETPGYPNRTTTDEPMYDNTHFVDKADAWDALVKEIEAYVNDPSVERLRQVLFK